MPLSLFAGHPTPDLLPAREISEAATTVLARLAQDPFQYVGDADNRHPLSYGTDRGNLTVRREVAGWLDLVYPRSSSADPDTINLTAGSLYGAMNILAQCTHPASGATRQAFVITPTYFLINLLLLDAGFGGKISAVEELAGGEIDFAGLEARLEQLEADPAANERFPVPVMLEHIPAIFDPSRPLQRIYRYVMYLVPSFLNPKGGLYPESTRRRLVALAQKYDILLLSDDVYDLLDYRLLPDTLPDLPPRLVLIDRETCAPDGFGHTISNGSFSKLLGPGLRVGWQELATPRLTLQLSQGGAHHLGGLPAQLNLEIVGEMIRSGVLAKVVRQLRTVYSARARTMLRAIREHLPSDTEVLGGAGGYFMWVRVPNVDMPAVVRESQARGVVLAGGENFEVTGNPRGWGQLCVRVCVLLLTEEQIQTAIEVFGKLVAHVQQQ